MSTKAKYTRKQLKAMMERYTQELMGDRRLSELPVTFAYEASQFGKTVSCHLRTTEGVVLEVDDLMTWFEKQPDDKQEEILASSGRLRSFGAV